MADYQPLAAWGDSLSNLGRKKGRDDRLNREFSHNLSQFEGEIHRNGFQTCLSLVF